MSASLAELVRAVRQWAGPPGSTTWPHRAHRRGRRARKPPPRRRNAAAGTGSASSGGAHASPARRSLLNRWTGRVSACPHPRRRGACLARPDLLPGPTGYTAAAATQGNPAEAEERPGRNRIDGDRIAGNAIGARAAGQPLDTAPWGAHAVTADFHAVPQVFFCDPPAAAVGLSAEQAERAGHRIRAVDVDLGEKVIGANLYADGYRGRARMVVDEDHGYLLGVTFVGPGIEELLHSATIAVAGQVPVDRLWHAVPCFPSISEVWLRLLEAYRG